MLKKSLIAIASSAAMLGAVIAPNAALASAALEAAKRDCVVGEQSDGYLGVVSGKSASAAVRQEIRSVNQQRKAAYARLADKNGVTTDVAARLTAEKLINRAPRGSCYRTAGGAWKEK